MKRITNRDRILDASIQLFNESGVIAVTTNHIASHLQISPGNLYFHFANKEEIIRELFERMCNETYEAWLPDRKEDLKLVKNAPFASPLELVEKSFEVFWKYRFFHREMFHLRRKDLLLAGKWKNHLRKCVRLLQANYGQWIKAGVMRPIDDPAEMRMVSDVVLITGSSVLQFFESADRPATRRTIRQGIDHIMRLLLPYHTDASQTQLKRWLSGS